MQSDASKLPAGKSQSMLGSTLSTHPQHSVTSPSTRELLGGVGKLEEQECDGTIFGRRAKTYTEYITLLQEEIVSFPDSKSRPCTMRVKRITPNHVVLETKRLPGQNNVGMEIYIPNQANFRVSDEVKCFVAFPEFEGSTITLSSGYQIRYNHHTYTYETRLFAHENWYPMADGFTLTQREWKMLADLKNER